ncbi:MAG: PAC2 family protein [Nanoarchaeota archaeon]|nr:PAC2 family protein [Nanoarchaeota archaeon]
MNGLWEVTAETKSLPTLNNPVLIEGLPGIGNVGKIAVDFLVEELKAKKLYSFFSYKFPHSVFVNDKNLVEMPKLELYYKQFGKGSKKHDLLFLVGDIQPIDEESCYAFCDEVLKIAQQNKCSHFITTGGIGLQHVPDKPKVYCTANNQALLREYLKKGMPLEKEIFGVVGPIIGVSGILLALGKKKNLNGVALLAETFGNPFYLGIKGAKEIVQVLEKKFSWKVKIKKINKDIREVENQLLQKATDWMSEEFAQPQAGAHGKKKDVHYIG